MNASPLPAVLFVILNQQQSKRKGVPSLGLIGSSKSNIPVFAFFYLTTFEKLLKLKNRLLKTVLGIRIRRIPVFLGLRKPDPLVRVKDPDPAPDPSLFS